MTPMTPMTPMIVTRIQNIIVTKFYIYVSESTMCLYYFDILQNLSFIVHFQLYILWYKMSNFLSHREISVLHIKNFENVPSRELNLSWYSTNNQTINTVLSFMIGSLGFFQEHIANFQINSEISYLFTFFVLADIDKICHNNIISNQLRPNPKQKIIQLF